MPYLMDSGYTANTATMGHHGTVTVRPSPPKPEQSQGDKALGLLRDFFSRRSHHTLLSVFREFDDSGEGYLSMGEFADGMKQLNIDLQAEDIEALFGMFSPDGDERISVSEFFNCIQMPSDEKTCRFDRVGIGRTYLKPNSDPPEWDAPVVPTNGGSGFSKDGTVCTRPGSTLNPPREASPFVRTPKTEKVLGTLREYFSIRPAKELLDIFQMFDTTKDGTLGFDEFCAAIKCLNYSLSADDMREVFSAFDTDGEGGVRINEFFNVLRGESSAVMTRRNVSGVAGMTSDVETHAEAAAQHYLATAHMRRHSPSHA